MRTLAPRTLIRNAVEQAVASVLEQHGAGLLKRNPVVLAREVTQAANRATYQTYREMQAAQKSK